MKHTIKCFESAIAVLLLMLSFGFTSCQDSDRDGDGGGDPEEPTSPIVGTWVLKYNDWDDEGDCYVFRKDGTGMFAEHFNRGADVDEHFEYTYNETTKKLMIFYYDEDGDFDEAEVYENLIINGNTATLSYNDELYTVTRQSTPIVVYDPEDSDMDYYWNDDDVRTYKCESSQCEHYIEFTPYILWHEDITLLDPLAVTVSCDWINCNLTGSHLRRLTLNIPENTKSTKKEYSIKLLLECGKLSTTGIFGNTYYIPIEQEAAQSSNGGNSGGNSGGNNSGNGSGSSSNEPQWGTVTATIAAYSGWPDDSYVEYIDGQTTTVDYVYFPDTGKYRVYGGIYCSDMDANGGKGVAYEAQKGYNSIRIDGGADYYYLGDKRMYYKWEVYMRVTLP